MELFIDKMSGIEFEDYLFNLFKKMNYEVEKTPASNDYGADLLLLKDGIKTVVQAKRYNSSVGVSAIQEIIGAKGYYNADKCLVITSNYFTNNAINLANANEVELWNRDYLVNISLSSISNSNIQSFKETTNKFDENESKEDELLYEALKIINESNTISTALLQRKLKIGYDRAINIINKLNEKGLLKSQEKSNKKLEFILSLLVLLLWIIYIFFV